MNGKQDTKLIIDQISNLLQDLSNQDYNKKIKVFNGGSIGEHIRHILEFYIFLINGTAELVIDHNIRKWNLAISKNIMAVKATLDFIENSISSLNESQSIKIISEYSDLQTNQTREECLSSIGRKLQYAFDHTIHRMALIRIGLETEVHHNKLDPELGIAPSTLKYRKNLVTDEVKLIKN